MSTSEIKQRLEYLRGELREERISWGELAELQELADEIEDGDVELLEAAGVPEYDALGNLNPRLEQHPRRPEIVGAEEGDAPS